MNFGLHVLGWCWLMVLALALHTKLLGCGTLLISPQVKFSKCLLPFMWFPINSQGGHLFSSRNRLGLKGPSLVIASLTWKMFELLILLPWLSIPEFTLHNEIDLDKRITKSSKLVSIYICIYWECYFSRMAYILCCETVNSGLHIYIYPNLNPYIFPTTVQFYNFAT